VSDALLLQKARHAYRQFIRDLSAFRARNVSLVEADPPVEPFVEIQRNDALNAFLNMHPEFREFREQLMDVSSEQSKFFFIEVRWQSVTSDRGDS
jgi:hypothetical protein